MEETLSDNLLNLRRYLPSQESVGTMDYWLGDNRKNKGIYVDLGAVMGNLKQAIKELGSWFKIKKKFEYTNREILTLIKESFGEGLCND